MTFGKIKSYTKTENFLSYFLELFLDGLTGPEDIDLYLFLADVHNRGNVFITLTLNVTKLHTTTLFLRQLFNEPFYHHDPVTLNNLFLWVGTVAIVLWIMAGRQCLGMIVHAAKLV